MRSVITCEANVGVCAFCYGRSQASGRLVDIGEEVGKGGFGSVHKANWKGTEVAVKVMTSDNITRDMLDNGTLARYIADRSVT